jgi:hypothetical protein
MIAATPQLATGRVAMQGHRQAQGDAGATAARPGLGCGSRRRPPVRRLMRKGWLRMLFVMRYAKTNLLAMLLASAPLLAQDAKKPAPEPLKIKVGDVAPDFTLLAFDGQKVSPVSLHDFKGKKNVVLAFYVFAFTGG